MSEETLKHPVFIRVVKYLQGGWPCDVEHAFDPFVHRKLELSIEEGYLV